MTRQAIEINGQTYWLKIGPKSIIYLSQIPNYSEEDVFVASIMTLQNITALEARSLCHLSNFSKQAYSSLFDEVISFLNSNMRDLYRKAVGEAGIDPATFFQLSLEEIEAIYEGYLRRQELAANLNKLAFLQALNNNQEQIQIMTTQEYSLGTNEERTNTFQRLGEVV